MRAVQLIEPNHVEVNDIDIPTAEGKALVRVETVGLCGTDRSIVAGKMNVPAPLPLVMGHEAVGVVERPGPLGLLAAGQRVLVDPGSYCEVCDVCRRGFMNLCGNGGLLGRELDGVFADYVAVTESNLLPVPDSISDDAAGLLQVLGTCVHSMRQAPVFPGDVAVVLGLGVGGQLISQLLREQGCTVIGVTRSKWKRDLADQLGAHITVEPADAAQAVADASGGRGAAVVVEAVGTEATFSQAIELCGPGGTVVLFGTATGGTAGLPYYLLYFKELTIRNPRGAKTTDYERGIQLVASGAVDPAPLVSKRFDLADANEALDAVADASTLKVLMTT
ncbi:MAG: zinc-dependent alcohol dehydrogenase [Acidimicrobiales bacterium]